MKPARQVCPVSCDAELRAGMAERIATGKAARICGVTRKTLLKLACG